MRVQCVTVLAILIGLLTSPTPLHAAEQPVESESPFPKLFAGLESPDVAVKDAAAKTLLKELATQIEASPKPYLKKIAAGVASPKPDESAAELAAWHVLYNTTLKQNSKTFAELHKTLIATDATIRKDAQVSFVRMINASIENVVIEKLIDGLAAPEASISNAAAEKLKTFGEEALLPLVSAIEDDRIQVRRLSVDVLKSFGPKAQSIAGQLAFLLDNDDKGIRRNAAAVLEHLGPDAVEAVDQLINYIDGDEKSVRRLAVNILKKIGPAAAEDATSALVDLLTYSEPDRPNDHQVRSLATEVLLTFGPAAAPEGLTPLIDLLKSDASDDDARERAISILVMLNGAAKPALPELKQLATSGGTETLKKTAAAALAKIEAAAVPPPVPVPVQEKK